MFTVEFVHVAGYSDFDHFAQAAIRMAKSMLKVGGYVSKTSAKRAGERIAVKAAHRVLPYPACGPRLDVVVVKG